VPYSSGTTRGDFEFLQPARRTRTISKSRKVFSFIVQSNQPIRIRLGLVDLIGLVEASIRNLVSKGT
jgi:hypothetical protein